MSDKPKTLREIEKEWVKIGEQEYSAFADARKLCARDVKPWREQAEALVREMRESVNKGVIYDNAWADRWAKLIGED